MNLEPSEISLGRPDDLQTIGIDELERGILKYGLTSRDYRLLLEYYRAISGSSINVNLEGRVNRQVSCLTELEKRSIGVGYYSDFDLGEFQINIDELNVLANVASRGSIVRIIINGVVRFFSPHSDKGIFYNALTEKYGRDKRITIIKDGLTVYNLSTQPK